MCGGKADRSAFVKLDPEVDSLLPDGELSPDTGTVQMAAVVRQRLHAAALAAEKESQALEAKRAAGEAVAAGVDLSLAAISPVDMTAQATEAQRRLIGLQEQAKAAEKSRQAADEARTKLRAIPSDDPQKASDAMSAARTVAISASNDVRQAERMLDELRKIADEKNAAVRLATAEYEAAKRNAELRSACEAQIAAGQVAGPTDAELIEADEAVEQARQRIEQAAIARKAAEQLDAANEFSKAAAYQSERAQRLRQAAWSVDSVLADQIATLGAPVAIKEGRMVATDKGREVFVHDLSPGQRAQLFGVPFVRVLGKQGLGTIDQRTWLQLDGRGKADLQKLVVESGYYVIAEGIEDDPEKCDRPISVEKFGE
jgi:hypothetical protein